jgi:hypothetical protein
MLLGSEELAANTPPLHYQCRSILLPVDRFEWEDMQGSPELEEKLDWTKWKDENGKAREALPPLKGFGNVDSTKPLKIASVRNTSSDTAEVPDSKASVIQDVKDLLSKKTEWTEENRISNIIQAGKKIRENVEYNYNSEMKAVNDKIQKLIIEAEQLNKKWKEAIQYGDGELADGLFRQLENIAALSEQSYNEEFLSIKAKHHRVLELLSEIRTFGNEGLQDITIAKSLRDRAKIIKNIEKYYPSDWWNESNDKPLIIEDGLSRSFYMEANADTPRIMKLKKGLSERVCVHEYGHLFEESVPSLKEVVNDYLSYRTNNRTNAVKTMQTLTGNKKYEPNEIGYDKTGFADPYMGKIYKDRMTEIMPIGTEGVFYNRYNMWDEDIESIDFIIGVLLSY